MRFFPPPIIFQSDQSVAKTNNQLRYESREEKEFTLAATAGFLSMWQPIPANSPVTNKPLTNVTLPNEIGYLVGSYLERKDGSVIAQTCRSANESGKVARADYLKKRPKSYQEQAYFPLIRLI